MLETECKARGSRASKTGAEPGAEFGPWHFLWHAYTIRLVSRARTSQVELRKVSASAVHSHLASYRCELFIPRGATESGPRRRGPDHISELAFDGGAAFEDGVYIADDVFDSILHDAAMRK